MLDVMDRHHLPRALQWTLLSFPNSLLVVVPPFSRALPDSAEVLVLEEAPEVREGLASRLALRVTGRDGGSRMFALDAGSEPTGRADTVADAGSVVVVEEDESAPNGRRFAYVAKVRHACEVLDMAACPAP